MNELHKKLIKNNSWYAKWHKHPNHQHAQFLLLIVVGIFFIFLFVSRNQNPQNKFALHGRQSHAAALSAQTPPVPAELAARCAAYPNPTVPAPLRTFYIDGTSGDDSNTGTSSATPWLTLDKANSTAQPGDRFYLRGSFSDQWISPAQSGTPTAKIVYAKEPGQNAILTIGKYDALLYFYNKHDIVVDGLELTNAAGPVEITNASNIWLFNLYVHHAGRIFVSASSNNWISDSTIEYIGDVVSNSGDGITFFNGGNNTVVVRNTFGRAGHTAITSTQQNTGNAINTGNVFALNKIRNQWAGGINLNGFTTNTLVECNDIAESGKDGFEVGSSGGILVSGTNNTVRFNLIHNTRAAGIDVEGYFYGGVQQDAINNKIYNNTIYDTGTFAAALGVWIKTVVKDNLIQNNIFVKTSGYQYTIPPYAQFTVSRYWDTGAFPFDVSTMNGNAYKYNIVPIETPYFSYASPNAGPSTEYTLASAASAFGWIGNKQGDALLMDPLNGNYRLSANSPAIDAGAVIPGVSFPFNGSAPDMGAIEYGGIVPPAGDATPPVVSLFSPTSGSTVSGTVTVSVNATDNIGVTSVQFNLDGAPLGAPVSASPYSTPWNTTAVANGTHTLTATARDAAGNPASLSSTVTVNNSTVDNQPPVVSMTAPANGSTVTGTVTVSATATDNVGVVGVQFKLDGANLYAEDTSAPYSIAWNTFTTTNGTHTLTSVARDAAGNLGTSIPVTVTVTGVPVGDTTAPLTSITSPVNNASVARGGSVTIAANASDNVAVVRVEFYVNGSLKCTNTISPAYSCLWRVPNSPNKIYNLMTKAYDAAGNIGTSALVTVRSGR